MTPIQLVLCCIALVLAPFGQAAAQSNNISELPDDVFFRAYLLGSDAEKLATAGDTERALEKFTQALSILDDLARTHPTWQPDTVRFRKGKLMSGQENAQAAKTKVVAPAPAPAPAPAFPPTVPAPIFSPQIMPTPGSSIPAATGNALNDAFGVIQTALADREALATQNQQLMAKVGQIALGYEAATQRLNEYVGAYQTLTKTATEQQARIAALEKDSGAGATAKAELERLRSEKIETDAMLSDAKARILKAERAVMDQSKSLMEASDKVAALQKEKATAEKERDALAKQNADLKTSLEKSTSGMAAVTKERDVLNTEIIGLKAMDGKGATEGMKKLAAENERLKADLATVQKQVTTLQADIGKKDTEIASLKGDLTKLQGELTALRTKNSAYETQVADLTTKIKELDASIAAAAKESKSDPQLTSENQLLRGIIMRQLRLQARQQTQNEAVIKEVKSMENASKTLLEQVAALDDNKFVLSQPEQKLFTTPQLQEMMGGEGLQATIVAQSTAKAGSPSPAPASQDAQKKIITDLIAKGNALIQDAKPQDAATAYQDALRADPKNMDAFLGLGWAQVQLSKHDDADISMRKALAHDPNNSTAHYVLGISLFRRDKVTDAQTAFEKSLQLDPKNARARHYLGVIANRMNLPQRAEKEFKSALAIDPTYGEAHFNLAVLYATWEPPKWDDARSEYDQALKKGVKANPDLEKLLQAKPPAEKDKTAAVANP